MALYQSNNHGDIYVDQLLNYMYLLYVYTDT